MMEGFLGGAMAGFVLLVRILVFSEFKDRQEKKRFEARKSKW